MSNLIDRDAFEVVGGFVPEGYDVESYLAGNKEILEMIDSAPIVDAVPVEPSLLFHLFEPTV